MDRYEHNLRCMLSPWCRLCDGQIWTRTHHIVTLLYFFHLNCWHWESLLPSKCGMACCRNAAAFTQPMNCSYLLIFSEMYCSSCSTSVWSTLLPSQSDISNFEEAAHSICGSPSRLLCICRGPGVKLFAFYVLYGLSLCCCLRAFRTCIAVCVLLWSAVNNTSHLFF